MVRLSFIRKHKHLLQLSFAAGLLVLVAALTGANAPVAHAADCDSNSIIYCGFSSASDFISKVRGNNSGNGHNDLQTIYAHYGLSSADYNTFASHAVAGTAYKNGTVVVNGQTVITDAKSIGRLASYQGSGYFTTTIGGTNYYGNTNARAFATDGLPVYVLFDASGTAQFAVLKSCGNPEFGTVVKTSASCGLLSDSAVSTTRGKAYTYKFSARASTAGNAKVVKYVYDFGDGTSKTITSNFSQSVSHTYPVNTSTTATKTYTARVTEYFSVPGNSNLAAPVTVDCTKQIVVQPSPPPPPPTPTYSCVQLAAPVLVDKTKNIYQFTVTGSYANGAKPSKAVFNFGDGKTQTVTLSSTKASTTHPYPPTTKDTAYSASVTLHYTVNGADKTTTSTNCQKKFTVAAPIYACLQLMPYELDKSTFSYKFVASSKVSAGVTLVSGDFTYGDGSTQKNIKASGSTVTATHQYAKAATYNISAVLHFTAYGNSTVLTARTCTAMVSPTAPPTPTCKPGVPVGSPACTPCQYNTDLSADSPDCVPPTLPNTGAGDTIAIFAGVIVVGFIGYRQILFRRHKAAFAAAQHGTAPLPLANPFNTDAPLAGTPVDPQQQPPQPVRSTFRRRRPF